MVSYPLSDPAISDPSANAKKCTNGRLQLIKAVGSKSYCVASKGATMTLILKARKGDEELAVGFYTRDFNPVQGLLPPHINQ